MSSYHVDSNNTSYVVVEVGVPNSSCCFNSRESSVPHQSREKLGIITCCRRLPLLISQAYRLMTDCGLKGEKFRS